MSHSKLFEHQELILGDDPTHSLLALGTGTGKTRTAILLARRRGKRALVVVPKITREVKTWQNECIEIGINPAFVTVVSLEDFRKRWEEIPYHDVLIGDEAHKLMGVYQTKRRHAVTKSVWVPKASQICEAMLGWALKHNPRAIYLCTATPDRNPMVIWGMGRLLGRNWDYDVFREKFYVQVRQMWLPRKTETVKQLLGQVIRDIGYAKRLEDCVDVPEQTFKPEYFALTKEQKDAIKAHKLVDTNPLTFAGAVHQIENGHLKGNKYRPDAHFETAKHERILELAEEFPKLLIFAKYTLQIEAIARILKAAGHPVMVITGETKASERAGFDKRADAAKKMIVIAQSTISEGYQLPTFPCTVFASMADGWIHYDQAIGRTLRMDHLKKNLYIFLITKGEVEKKATVGGVDEAAHKTVMQKKDFSMAKFLQDNDLFL